jgi:two-component system, chemotaxis family, chemotaxis protein CheV
MKDKRNFILPSNKLINKVNSNIAELLEFELFDADQQRTFSYLVNIAKVLQVMPLPTMVTPNNQAKSVLGKILVRERPVPVIDLGQFLSLTHNQGNPPRDLIVLSFLDQFYGMLTHNVKQIHYVS